MKIFEIRPHPGSRSRRHRVGRGHGCGSVKTAGRGGKGQTARSGSGKGRAFEGGQTPWYRRLPKLKGFKNFLFRKKFQEVPLYKLNQFEDGTLVNPALLFEKRFIRKPSLFVKILGNGELTKSVTVQAHAFSQSAQEKIKAKGGAIELLS